MNRANVVVNWAGTSCVGTIDALGLFSLELWNLRKKNRYYNSVLCSLPGCWTSGTSWIRKISGGPLSISSRFFLTIVWQIFWEAKKFEKFFHLKFDVNEWRQILSGRFFQILWPSQNTQTLKKFFGVSHTVKSRTVACLG